LSIARAVINLDNPRASSMIRRGYPGRGVDAFLGLGASFLDSFQHCLPDWVKSTRGGTGTGVVQRAHPIVFVENNCLRAKSDPNGANI
jgi:hypothetical protein